MTGDRDIAFVGTRGDVSHEIFTYEIDESTGSLTEIAVSDGGENPAFLAIHPNNRYLYAVNQVEDGGITALEIFRDGSLTKLNHQPTNDLRPCFVSLDLEGRYAFVAHHTGGSICVFPILDDGTLGEATDFIVREGSGVDPDRQSKSRPHSIRPDPENRYIYVPDLGADRIWIYEFNSDSGTLEPIENGEIELHEGAGPRHMDYHPHGRFVYVLNELDATLTAFCRDRTTGSLRVIETVNLLPKSFSDDNISADVHVHPSGKWVYASNRGHNSVSIFDIDSQSGRLTFVGRESTRGEWPRNFAIHPSGRYLFVENQKTNSIVGFEIDDDAGTLTRIEGEVDLEQPVCMQFLPRGRSASSHSKSRE